MTVTKETILFVDDEPNVLNGIRRQFYRKYDMEFAVNGHDAISLFSSQQKFAVVVSDMRMPEMDGIELLSRIKAQSPNTVRVMLTGNSDQYTAMQAINEGSIFRFITKPCSPDNMASILDAALDQYRLINAERELLENTLNGTINALTDILSLTAPIAFSRAKEIKNCVHQIVKRLGLSNVWCHELAAMLSQIGCVLIPSKILENFYASMPLDKSEQAMIDQYPKTGYDLLKHIPHLDIVAEIILHHREDYSSKTTKSKDPSDTVSIGSDILHVATDYSALLSQGNSNAQSIGKLKQEKGTAYNPHIIDELHYINPPQMEKIVKTLTISDIYPGMKLEEDVRTKKGVLLVKYGQTITPTVRSFLLNHLKQNDIEDQVVVSLTKAEFKPK